MDNLVDFEALIDINEIMVTMEKMEREVQNISQNSFIDVLDKMCDEDEIENTKVINLNTDSKMSAQENTDSPDDVMNLDCFGGILNEMRMSLDTVEKLRQREFSITAINTEINEQNIESVDPSNISKIVKTARYISENDPVIDLNEFEMIFNDICVSNDKIESQSILNTTKIQKEKTLTSSNVIDLDEIEDTVNDHIVQHDKSDTVTDTLKLNGECSLENQATVNLGANKTETESDDVGNNLNHDVIKKEDNLKTNVSKSTLSPDSEDDGYNSSDFEFITESDAKKNCLAKTNLQNYSYYNADYRKYHKSRYLPCKVISAKAKRVSHVIPQGESYLDLFRGMYAPAVVNNLYYASRKRVLPVTSMTVQDGCGFDVFENNCEENQECK